MELTLIIPDTHAPYHHKGAYKLMLEVARELNPKNILFLGDFVDFYSVSSHPKSPNVFNMLKDEIAQCLQYFEQFDEMFPDANITFLQGNHEYRLERYLVQKAPELFGLTSTYHLLDFNKRPHWKYIPYGPNQMIQISGSKLFARHEPLGTNAKLTASKALCSLVYGHIHRIEESHIVGLDGTNHVAFSVGWLGDKRKDEVFGYVKGHHQWQLGFGLVYTDPKSGLFYHQKVHILEVSGKLSCCVNGKIYCSK